MRALRVLVGCLLQEGDSFSPGVTTWHTFRDAGVDVVPSVCAWAPPGPPVEAPVHQRLGDAIDGRMAAAPG